MDFGESKGGGGFETSGTASPTRRRYSIGTVFGMMNCGYEVWLDCAAQHVVKFHLFVKFVRVCVYVRACVDKERLLTALCRADL